MVLGPLGQLGGWRYCTLIALAAAQALTGTSRRPPSRWPTWRRTPNGRWPCSGFAQAPPIRRNPDDAGGEPQATLLNYPAKQSASRGSLALTAFAARPLAVKNYGGPTHLVIDVFGYYEPPISALLRDSGGVFSGSARVLDSRHLSEGHYLVTIDRTVRDCTVLLQGYVDYVHAQVEGRSGSQIAVFTYRSTLRARFGRTTRTSRCLSRADDSDRQASHSQR